MYLKHPDCTRQSMVKFASQNTQTFELSRISFHVFAASAELQKLNFISAPETSCSYSHNLIISRIWRVLTRSALVSGSPRPGSQIDQIFG